MLSMLIAYDSEGNVVATLDHLVARDQEGRRLGLYDFTAIEDRGLPLRLREDGSAGVWNVPNAVGSGSWPEWLGRRALDFRVVLEGKKIVGLTHRKSGVRRNRATVEQAIADRISAADGRPADIRDLVGGPEVPLVLDDNGVNTTRTGS